MRKLGAALVVMLLVGALLGTQAEVARATSPAVTATTPMELYGWGDNEYGQLGDGTTTNRSFPAQVGTATDWASVVAGGFHAVGIKTDGTLWAWGSNELGQLGDGTTTNRTSPVQVGTATDWAKASAGGGHTVAVKTDGTLWAWGSNELGQVGDGTATNRTSPVQVGTATDWAKASAGGGHTVAVKTDGSLWAWGYNGNGAVGDGTTTRRSSPVQVGTATNWAAVSAGDGHTVAVKTDGSLWAWGDNFYGQLGDGATTNRSRPVPVGLGHQWVTVSGGENCTMASALPGGLSGVAPGAPIIGPATAGDAKATVSWTAPASDGGSPITGYVITPYIGSSPQSPVIFDSTATTQTVTGLTSGTTYSFTVAAINAVAVGPESAPSNPVTPPPTPPGAPTILRNATAGNRSATISWLAPAFDGGSPIVGYVVTAYVGYAPVAFRVFNSTLTTQTVTGLTNGTTYRFRVRAYNAVGFSGYSTATNPVTPSA